METSAEIVGVGYRLMPGDVLLITPTKTYMVISVETHAPNSMYKRGVAHILDIENSCVTPRAINALLFEVMFEHEAYLTHVVRTRRS